MSGKNIHKPPLIVLTGPTAVGKTELSIRLAKAINGEIISADSMQVYRGMDIGTAKIKKEEMQGVEHHLIDILEPDEEFNIFEFKKQATAAIEKIYANGHIPIIVGGTGFYIQSVLYDIKFSENENDDGIRAELTRIYNEKGAVYVHDMLKDIDPEYANSVHYNNVKRVIRAIEFYKQTGRKMSEHNKEQHNNESKYNFIYLVLNDNRDRLYERIDKRVDIMISDGLVEEVESLLKKGYTRDLISMQGLGYKEIIAYLNNEITLDEAVYIIKRDTRHFAKRQLTWFRREKEVTMIDLDKINRNEAFDIIIELIKQKDISINND